MDPIDGAAIWAVEPGGRAGKDDIYLLVYQGKNIVHFILNAGDAALCLYVKIISYKYISRKRIIFIGAKADSTTRILNVFLWNKCIF